MKIAITGGSGLVGSRIIELLKERFEFINVDRTNGYDILDPKNLSQIANDSSISLVLHLAAYTNVDGSELDKEKGEESEAWKLNVTGTKNIISVCKSTNKKLIYISTEFVFDGEKGEYVEDDMPRPVNWYGQTKYEGEKLVQNSGLEYMILRLSSPYRAEFEIKKDFMRAMKSRLEAGQEIVGVTDHIFTPTFIDDFVNALGMLISKNAEGIYHVVGDDWLSPYEAEVKIADMFDLDKNLIKETTRSEYFKGKAKRGFQWSVKNDKIKSLGIEMKTFKEGLEEIQRQSA